MRLVSTDGADEPTRFRRGTADGNVVFMSTTEQLLPQDRDAGVDIYARRSSGALELISTSGSDKHAFLLEVSADGMKVWFETDESLTDGEVPGGTDIYERDRATGALRLISGGGFGGALLRGASQDGRRVWFETFQDIPGTGDNDPSGDVDLYERLDGTALRLISDGGASGQTGLHARFRGAAPNGAHVWFETTERIAGTGDRDNGLDIFERRVGFPATLVSPGTTGAFARFRRASADGRWVIFESTEQISGFDTNQSVDVYATAAPLGLTQLISPGPSGAHSVGVADNGSRTWFSSGSRLDPADTDNTSDIYERDLTTDAVRLISTL